MFWPDKPGKLKNLRDMSKNGYKNPVKALFADSCPALSHAVKHLKKHHNHVIYSFNRPFRFYIFTITKLPTLTHILRFEDLKTI